MKTRTDKTLMVLTALFVGALAIVAGAISFSHMRELALDHGQLGWKSLAFPISVDGLEIVASLYLVAVRRAGRPTGWIPWATLLVGTGASFAANVAVGGEDPIGKALAGWPALSMLVSVKLLFAMFDHDADDQRTVRDDHRTVPDDPAVPMTVPVRLGPSGTAGEARTDGSQAPSNTVRSSHQTRGGKSDDPREAAHLIPAARAARMAVVTAGQTVTRDRLADAMRDAGTAVSNARAGLLLTVLRAEESVSAIDSGADAHLREDAKRHPAEAS